MKNQYVGGVALKRGLGQFADIRGAWKKRGGKVFLMGVDISMYNRKISGTLKFGF